MFKYVTVSFPYSVVKPSLIHEFSFKQDRYEHEYAVILFKDWNLNYNDVKPMSPVIIKLQTPEGSDREFNGYVHHIKPIYSPGERSVEVHIIGASYVMKNTSQAIYSDVTADQLLKKIARKYEFSYFTEPHPRVFPQIAQAGRSDWQLLVWLAKKVGYTLRAENTSLYFYPLSKDYSENRTSAPRYTLNTVETLGGTNAYSFTPIVGEHLALDMDEDDRKSAIAYSGVDRFAQINLSYTNQKSKKATRKNSVSSQFDRFAVNTVIPSSEIAIFEAEAAEERQRFGYRGYAEVFGDPALRPDLPIYFAGVGEEYTGYWVVLSTEHKIERTLLHTFTYTTIVLLGIDSLGSSNSWGVDRFVEAPNTKKTRTIKPNIKNTQRKDISKLKVKGFYNKTSNRNLTMLKNKKSSAQAPKWSSSVKDLKTTTPTSTYKPSFIVKKLLNK